VCLDLKDIPPNDLDDEILGRMFKEVGMFYKMELERLYNSRKRNNLSFFPKTWDYVASILNS